MKRRYREEDTLKLIAGDSPRFTEAELRRLEEELLREEMDEEDSF